MINSLKIHAPRKIDGRDAGTGHRAGAEYDAGVRSAVSAGSKLERTAAECEIPNSQHRR